MALIAVDAVVYVARYLVVLEVVGIVSAMASRALEDGVVVRIDVACRAHAIGVPVSNGELGVLRVIEGCVGPGGGVVAVLTSRREELRLRRMAGIGGVVVVRLVAANTGRRQSRVVAVHVAIGALPRRDGVGTGQGEWRVVVIEGRVGPDHSVMTQLAGSRESGRGVRRIVGVRVIGLMARVAERAVQGVVVVLVAIRTLARRHGVRSRQLEAG